MKTVQKIDEILTAKTEKIQQINRKSIILNLPSPNNVTAVKNNGHYNGFLKLIIAVHVAPTDHNMSGVCMSVSLTLFASKGS